MDRWHTDSKKRRLTNADVNNQQFNFIRGKLMRYVALFLILAATVCGANKYLNAADCDGNGDGSAGDPWGSFAEAISEASDGDTIYVSSATNTDPNNGTIVTAGAWDEGINISSLATNLHFTKDPTNTATVSLQPTNDSTYPCRIAAGAYTGSLSFSDITFDASEADGRTVVFLNQDDTCSVTFTRCNFIPDDATTTLISVSAAGSALQITLEDCTCTALDNTQARFIQMVAGGLLHASGCVVDFTLGSTSAGYIYELANLSDLVFVGNTTTFMCGGIASQWTTSIPSLQTFPTRIYVTGNKFSRIAGGSANYSTNFGKDANLIHAGTATGACAVDASLGILLACDAVLADDWWNDAYIKITSGTGAGQLRKITDYDKTGNAQGEKYATVDTAWATNTDETSVYYIWFDLGTEYFEFSNNVIINNSTSNEYGVNVGMGIKNALVSGNYIYQPDQEKAITIRSINATVINNIAIGYDAFQWQGTGHCDVRNNTFVTTSNAAFTWRKNGVYTSNPPLGTLTAENNIFYASGSGNYCVLDVLSVGESTGDHNNPKLNYNCYYYTDSAIAGLIDDVECATLADLQTEWATTDEWGSTTFIWHDNDADSVNYDPQFDLNYMSRNRRLQNAGTPLMIKSDGTTESSNNIGATPSSTDSRPTRRRRII